MTPNFQGLLSSLVNLISNLNVRLDIYHIADDFALINRSLMLGKVQLPAHFRDFMSFEHLVDALISEGTPTDLIVVASFRNLDSGWAQGVNLLPRMLARQLPDASFVVAYAENPDMDEFKIDLLYTN